MMTATSACLSRSHSSYLAARCRALLRGVRRGSAWMALVWLGAVCVDAAAEPRLERTDTAITVTHGALEVAWERDGAGTPARIRAGERVFDMEAGVSPLVVEAWEIDRGEPWSDRLSGRPLAARAEPLLWETEQDAAAVTVRVSGGWRWAAKETSSGGLRELLTRSQAATDDRLTWSVAWHFEAGHPGVEVSCDLGMEGDWHNRVLREVSWQLPLGLEQRKRVAQGGEQGVHWDTRYFYHYTVYSRMLMPHPEVNIWRHFTVEQETPDTFRIWRAEADTTAPLVMQRGTRAAGWVGVYDQQGGFFAAYRDLARRAPKALRVDARDAGLLRLQLVPPTAPAVHPRAGRFDEQVLGTHRLDLAPFEGAWNLEQQSAGLRARWGLERLASDEVPVRTLPTDLETWDAWIAGAADPRRPVFPVTGTVPLPRGTVFPDMGMRVFVDRQEHPLQWRPAAYWPDGSVKWALLVFPLDPETLQQPGKGTGKSFSAEITLRGGGSLPLRIEAGSEVQPATSRRTVAVSQDGGNILLDTEALRLVLQPGRNWLREVRRAGRRVLRASGEPLAFVDYLELTDAYRPLDTHAQGRLLPGPVEITELRIEEAGPLRSVVRLAGQTAGKEPVKVILRIEAYAGSEWVRVWKSVEFLDADPRERMAARIGIALPLRLRRSSLAVHTGDAPSRKEDAARGSLYQFSPRGHRLRTMQDGGDCVEASGKRSQGWMTFGDRSVAATVIQRYFWQEAPRENRATCNPAPVLTAYFWPDAAPVMDVRRYSDFPHRAQGESAPNNNNDWVYSHYYRQDPFKGISKTYETLWGFHEPGLGQERLEGIAADFHSRPLIYAGEEQYRTAGIALPWGASKDYPDISANLERVSDFWLFHQRFWDWYGPWQHGDTVHGFSGGYGDILPAGTLRAQLALPENKRYTDRLDDVQRDYHPNHNWTFDNGRWGWSMTEKLPGQFWQMQYLRSGRRDVFFQAEAIAANSRDVVVRHHGRWFGRGTRHGVQHWSCGNHEERQTVALEWRLHYLLTGDARSADVLERLTQKHYLDSTVGGAAAPSGRLPGLLMHWERTGSQASREALEQYLAAMVDPQGIRFPRIDFREQRVLEPGPLNSPSMFFHTFGAMHAVIETMYLMDNETLRQEVHDALLRMAGHFVDTDTLYAGGLVIAYAAKHAPEPEKFLAAVNRLMVESNRWRYLYQTVTGNRAHWSGPSAILQGAATGSWSVLNKVPYMTTMWESQPGPSEEQRAQMEQFERDGREPRMDILDLDWQSEYDHPDFNDYLGRWRPWSPDFVHPRDRARR